MVKVLFFGITHDIAGTGEKSYSSVDLEMLRKELEEDFAELSKCRFRFAVNGELKSGNAKLNENDTVALLPPFAGG